MGAGQDPPHAQDCTRAPVSRPETVAVQAAVIGSILDLQLLDDIIARKRFFQDHVDGMKMAALNSKFVDDIVKRVRQSSADTTRPPTTAAVSQAFLGVDLHFQNRVSGLLAKKRNKDHFRLEANFLVEQWRLHIRRDRWRQGSRSRSPKPPTPAQTAQEQTPTTVADDKPCTQATATADDPCTTPRPVEAEAGILTKELQEPPAAVLAALGAARPWQTQPP